MNKCKKCGMDFEGNFCPNCGAAFISRCTACGCALRGDYTFCAQCGSPLDGKKPVTTQHVPIAPRGNHIRAYRISIYLLTILFVGLVFAFLAAPLAKDPFLNISMGNGYDMLALLNSPEISEMYANPIIWIFMIVSVSIIAFLRLVPWSDDATDAIIGCFAIATICELGTAIIEIDQMIWFQKNGWKVGECPILFIVFGFLFFIGEFVLFVLYFWKKRHTSVS